MSDESPEGVAEENDVTLAAARGRDGVTVRYWAAARAAAGVETETVVGATLAEVEAAVVRRRPGDRRFADVLGICSVLVGEIPVGGRDHADVALEPGSLVEFLPPFAGG